MIIDRYKFEILSRELISRRVIVKATFEMSKYRVRRFEKSNNSLITCCETSFDEKIRYFRLLIGPVFFRFLREIFFFPSSSSSSSSFFFLALESIEGARSKPPLPSPPFPRILRI